MKRRHRLSRSRDFDAVYRHGRSVSSRYLVLYAFPRSGSEEAPEEARLGLAVSRQVGDAPDRNRVKRQLRAAFDELRAEIQPGQDYVLIVRPGFVEAASTRGFPWVVERVREVLGQARALAGATPR